MGLSADQGSLFFALRPRQWIKNLLVFLPLIFGQRLFDFPTNLHTLLCFLLLCLAASAVYLMNDLFDLEKDRLHPTKRLRAIASNRLRPRLALGWSLMLAVAALGGSFWLKTQLGYVVLAYLVVNVFYSWKLKEKFLLDVFIIGGLFLLRIVAGTLVSDVYFSHWMILMVVLLALFLVFSKRRMELSLPGIDKGARPTLFQYETGFLDQVILIVASSIAVVYMLYTVDVRTVRLVGNLHLMYSIPFVYYGLFRFLFLMRSTKGVEDDPVGVFLSDGLSQLNLVLWALVCLGVVYFGL